jgi:hypothetical protein
LVFGDGKSPELTYAGNVPDAMKKTHALVPVPQMLISWGGISSVFSPQPQVVGGEGRLLEATRVPAPGFD